MVMGTHVVDFPRLTWRHTAGPGGLMHALRSTQLLSILATLVACSPAGGTTTGQPDAAVAAAPVAAPVAAPEAAPAPAVGISLNWDSRPLDQEYRRERANLDAQHAREISVRVGSETDVQRTRRQASENQVLEVRYTRGKTAHAKTLPRPER